MKQETTVFKKAIRKANTCKVVVNLDWLSVEFRDIKGSIPNPETKEDIIVNERITLFRQEKGTEVFSHRYYLYYNAEHLATLMAHSHISFIAKDVVKIDFANHLLYSKDIWIVYDDIVSSLKLEYKIVNRADIAIDGMNYLHDFLNGYIKQEADQKNVLFKGKAEFKNGILDSKTMKFKNFSVGDRKGRKNAVVYNKSSDIVKKGKNYIFQYWKENGILKRLNGNEQLEKEITGEKVFIEGHEDIYRFEMRLKHEKLKQIRGFNIEMLKTANYLVSIVKLMTRNFFDFIWNDNPNVSNCSPIQIIPFDKFEIVKLEKVERVERDDLYKTKLSIKKNVRQLYLGKHDIEHSLAYESIKFDIQQFDLKKWFLDKLRLNWDKDFSKLNHDTDHLLKVRELMKLIGEELELVM